MTVYSYRILDELYTGIRRTASKLLDGYNVKLNASEFVKAFIEPDHVEPLKKTEELVGMVGEVYANPVSFALSDGKLANFRVTFARNKPPIILPNYLKNGPVKSAPAETIGKLKAYADERVRIGRMFGDALDAVRYLNDACGNAPAMAVMFPAIPALFRYFDTSPDSPNAKRAQKIVDAKSFGVLPRLPPEVKARMLECSNLVLNTMMLEPLPAADQKATKNEATLEIVGMKTEYNDFIYEVLGQIKPAAFI